MTPNSKAGAPAQPGQSGKKPTNAISPTRTENYPEWYQSVIRAADMAEHSDVRGCMVIKPWGYGLWERIQQILDRKFKDTGHKNAYFPLLIPLSFLQKEAEHVTGFAKECAVVTHRRLVQDEAGKLVPASPLEEALIIRPTSETIIGASFAKWVQSYRDLPVLINQWANVMRWEMRTRLFLRTAEFLWQEGHTVHETAEDALEETRRMLDVYASFARDALAMPVIQGEKTAGERFPGAVNTFAIEAMMQDGKALQAGTSHFLGQNFAKAQGIRFLGRDNREAFAWTTSWGVSTRLIGGVIMTHADDDGMVVPPRIAPTHVVFLPVIRKPEDAPRILEAVDALAREVRSQKWGDEEERIEVEVDRRDVSGADRFWSWVKKGVPLVVEIGARDLEGGNVCLTRRDELSTKRQILPREKFVATVGALLQEIQSGLLAKAQARMDRGIFAIESEAEFDEFFGDEKEADGQGKGFALAHCSEGALSAEKLAARKVTIRCVPLPGALPAGLPDDGPGKCLFSGEPTTGRVLLARSY
jgi:prolyl-tRNA synthetase